MTLNIGRMINNRITKSTSSSPLLPLHDAHSDMKGSASGKTGVHIEIKSPIETGHFRIK